MLMNFSLKLMNYVLKMMNSVLKMMKSGAAVYALREGERFLC